MATTFADHSDLPRRPTARILRAAEATAWQTGFGFLEAARREAERINEAARQSYANEFDAGYEEGKARGEAEASRIIAEATVKVDRYLKDLEGEVVSLAFDVVKQVLGEIDLGELVAKAAQRAISDIRNAKYLKIAVHPEVAGAVIEHLQDMLQSKQIGFRVEVVPNEALAIRDCKISTDIAVINAGIDAQLEAIQSAISAQSSVQQ